CESGMASIQGSHQQEASSLDFSVPFLVGRGARVVLLRLPTAEHKGAMRNGRLRRSISLLERTTTAAILLLPVSSCCPLRLDKLGLIRFRTSSTTGGIRASLASLLDNVFSAEC